MFKLFKVLFIALLPVLVIFTMMGAIGTRLKYKEQIDNGTMTEQQVATIIKDTPFFQKFIVGIGSYNEIVGDTLIGRWSNVLSESNIFDSANYTDVLTSLRTIGSALVLTPRLLYETIAWVINLFRWWDFAFTIRN